MGSRCRNRLTVNLDEVIVGSISVYDGETSTSKQTKKSKKQMKVPILDMKIDKLNKDFMC